MGRAVLFRGLEMGERERYGSTTKRARKPAPEKPQDQTYEPGRSLFSFPISAPKMHTSDVREDCFFSRAHRILKSNFEL